MQDALWIFGAIAVCVLLLWISSRIEPHWSTRDGRRFLTTAQPLDDGGHPIGRRHEVRVAVDGDGSLRVGRRRVLGTREARWRMLGKSPSPPRGKAVYLLGTIPQVPKAGMLALRLPAKSRVVPVLDDLVDDRSGETGDGHVAAPPG